MSRPATAGNRRRRDRGSISVDEILSGAFEVASKVSIANLSMPQLAKHLGVGVTSIYWYFRRKDDLLDAMAERLLREHDFSVFDIDAGCWRTSLHTHAHRMRETFQSNPVLCDLVLLRGTVRIPAARDALERLEAPMAALISAGLTAAQAFDTYSSISVLVRSSAVLHRLQARSASLSLPRDYWHQVIDPESMPLISSVSGDGYRIGAADLTNFDHILECILDRAQALIAGAARDGAQPAQPFQGTCFT